MGHLVHWESVKVTSWWIFSVSGSAMKLLFSSVLLESSLGHGTILEIQEMAQTI